MTLPALGRRRLLTAGVTAAGGAVAVTTAGCDLLTTEPAGPGPAGSTKSPARRGGHASRPHRDREAPILAERVRAGKLPPLRDRLPDRPLVVEPAHQLGTYGGTWRSALLGSEEKGYVYTYAQYDNLLRWRPHQTGKPGVVDIAPDIAEGFEIGRGGRDVTFRLRAGMKWSDGRPFTADDVLFAVEDVLLNTDITPVLPSILATNGEPPRIEKQDEQTFTFVFPSPAGLFLLSMLYAPGDVFTHYPRHYLEQFHQKYNPDVDRLVKDEQATDWVQLFSNKTGPSGNWGSNPDLPTLGAWRLVTPFGEGQRVVLERNPYYWKVDPGGSQLPYLDSVVFDIVEDLEVMLLKATNGEITLEVPPKPRFATPANKPLLARNRSKGHYRFIGGTAERANLLILQLNLTHEDPNTRAILQDKDFRIGLSYAINRPELIKVAVQRQGEPSQCAPRPESPFYDEEFATQYTEHDIDRANAHLDKAFPDRDANRRRLGPDGKPIFFTIEFTPFRPEWADMLELIKGYWKAVGVEVALKSEDRALFILRTNANKHDAAVWHAEGGLDMFLWPQYYAPVSGDLRYGVLWRDWYQPGGPPGERPPAATRRQLRLFDRIRSSVDADEQTALMKQVLAIAKEEFYVIGTVRETQKFYVASDTIRNLPDNLVEGWTRATPGPSQTEQYFLST